MTDVISRKYSFSDDSLQSSPPAYCDDSCASTSASLSSSEDSLPRGTKTKLPSNFGFLREEPRAKKRRAFSLGGIEGAGRWLRVAGPESIHTLRGHLFGRPVALVLAGESHEDTIDLTRKKTIVKASMGWISLSPNQAGFNPEEVVATKDDVTLGAAKKWAAGIIKDLESTPEDLDYEGAKLVFVSLGRMKGSAIIFPPWATRNMQHQLLPGTAVLEWADADDKAREFNLRRLDTAKMPVSAEEQDALIAERKLDRLGEGIELFDDWLVRQANSKSVRVEFVLEAPVAADELELHEEPDVSAAPVAHECLRCMDLDSDEEEDRQTKPGNGSFLDTLRRQAMMCLPPGRLHCADPRVLGDSEDSNLPKALHGSFQTLVREPSPKCMETLEIEGLDATPPAGEDDECQLPSWEAFLGGAADLLYHAKHVKADYVPFLTGCVRDASALRKFHDALYFGTVPEALSEITMNEETRPFASVRSLLHQAPNSGTAALPRPMGHCSDRRKPIPVRSAPVDRYLKAKGFDTPRTWVSGLAEKLRQSGHESFVNTTREWYWDSVNRMLADPKKVDTTGDYFAAYLYAAHREIFEDIEDTDPTKLRRCTWAPSKAHPKSKEHRHNLKDIQIPSLEDTFAELLKSRPCTEASSRRERVLGQIIVDVFQLRLVDLAMVLKVANAVVSAPEDEDIAVVVYAGSDHTNSIIKFWKQFGFSATGLSKKGYVGMEQYKPDEPKCLSLPSYLCDLSKLFPIPASPQKRCEKKCKSKRRRSGAEKSPKKRRQKKSRAHTNRK